MPEFARYEMRIAFWKSGWTPPNAVLHGLSGEVSVFENLFPDDSEMGHKY
ncbi:hypothetical protein [Paraburkholderia nodosa]|nr:hypothetical protein [Paraburkholderia nodosa]